MKRNSLISLLAGIAFLLPVSCVREEPFQEGLTGHELILDIGVEGMATRAVNDPLLDVPALKEDAVEELDIYISGTFSSGDPVRHYHLTSANQTPDGKWKVVNDRRSEGYVDGNQYTVYVAANSKRIKRTVSGNDDYTAGINSLSLTGVSTLAALQTALKDVVEYDYDPTEPNIPNAPTGYQGTKPYWGAHNDDNVNPEWLDLHKKYIESPTVSSLSDDKQKRFYTNDKSFLMDGSGSFIVGNTTPTITLYRAAAKIILDVKFDNAFLAQFGKHPVGAPAWEFINFAFSTPVFDASHLGQTGSPYAGNSIFTAGALMMSQSGDDFLQYSNPPTGNQTTGYDFSLQTYSYPLEWESGTGDNGAPGIIISVNYKQNASAPDLFQYYKIPIVDPSPTGTDPFTSLDRNKVYRISATISSEGGNLLTEAYEVKCNFDILPWGGAIQGAEVDGTEDMYFNVSPKEIILRGDGLQTADIKIIKPESKKIGLRYFTMPNATFEYPFNETDTITVQYSFTDNVAQNAPAPYYFNYKGEQRKVFTRTLAQGGVTYGDLSFIQNKFRRTQYGDKLTLESYHLPNRGVKYMKIRVNLDVPNWKTKKLYQDIIIRHYPTDYITSIQGDWASRISAASVLDPSDPYYKAHNNANKGPEEYALGTEYTHFREVFIAAGGSSSATGTTVTSNQDEYETGINGPYPGDFTYTLVASTHSEYLSNQAADNPDPRYVRDEEPYSYYFWHNSASGVSDILSPETYGYINNSANRPDEAHAFGPVTEGSNQWYYWGEGTPTVVESRTIETDSHYSGNSPTIYISYFTIPSSVQDFDFYEVSNLDRSRQYSYNNYYYKADFTFYRYPQHRRAKNYQKPQYSCKEFSFSGGYGPNTLSPTGLPTDPNLSAYRTNLTRRGYRWVNLGKQNSTDYYDFGKEKTDVRTNSIGSQNTVSEKPFAAKHMSGNNNSVVYSVNLNGSNVVSDLDAKSSYNNHMFILRLSETTSSYAIGHPVLDNHGLSQDNVVAPALMIASQLGATSNMPSIHADGQNTTTYYQSGGQYFFHGVDYVTSNQELYYWQARHCATYLEVGKEGIWEVPGKSRYYSDWRLPTRAEIDLIIAYQGYAGGSSIPSELRNTAFIDGFVIYDDDRIINPVLTGQYYRALDQSEATVKNPLAAGTHTVRCVRELTLKELEYLENL